MSEIGPPRGIRPPPPPDDDVRSSPGLPPPPQRSGCLTAFMVIVGIILLLPGLCALIFGADNLMRSHPDPTVLTLVMICLLVAAGGILLIRAAIRGPRP
jgi:hypothetical protein